MIFPLLPQCCLVVQRSLQIIPSRRELHYQGLRMWCSVRQTQNLHPGPAHSPRALMIIFVTERGHAELKWLLWHDEIHCEQCLCSF